jgi:hypothetical protein
MNDLLSGVPTVPAGDAAEALDALIEGALQTDAGPGAKNLGAEWAEAPTEAVAAPADAVADGAAGQMPARSDSDVAADPADLDDVLSEAAERELTHLRTQGAEASDGAWLAQGAQAALDDVLGPSAEALRSRHDAPKELESAGPAEGAGAKRGAESAPRSLEDEVEALLGGKPAADFATVDSKDMAEVACAAEAGEAAEAAVEPADDDNELEVLEGLFHDTEEPAEPPTLAASATEAAGPDLSREARVAAAVAAGSGAVPAVVAAVPPATESWSIEEENDSDEDAGAHGRTGGQNKQRPGGEVDGIAGEIDGEAAAGPNEAVGAAELAALGASEPTPDAAAAAQAPARSLVADMTLMVAQLVDLPFAWLDGASKQAIGVAAVLLTLAGLLLIAAAYVL